MLSKHTIFDIKMEVHYIHGHLFDRNDPILRKIEEFCEFHKIQFKTRNYDSGRFEEDREWIKNLPSIHIYHGKYYNETYCVDLKVIQSLQIEFDKYVIERLERKAKRQIWRERIEYLKTKFLSLKTDYMRSKRRK